MKAGLNILLGLLVTTILISTATAKVPLKDRTRFLEQEVKGLKSDVAELKKITTRLNNTLQAFITNKTHQAPRKMNKTIQVKKIEHHNPFRVLNISRINVGRNYVNHSVKFSINHTFPVSNVFSHWNRQNKDFSYSPLNYTMIFKNRKMGITNVSASVVTIAENETSVIFVFGADEIWYSLHLNNSGLKNTISTNIPLPELYVEPGRIAYSRGKNASFRVIVSKATLTKGDIHLDSDYITKAGKNEFVGFFNIPGTVTKFAPAKDSVNLSVSNMTYSTSEQPVSGVITLKSKTPIHANSTLNNVNVYRRTIIHPSDQPSPFKDNSLVFYTKSMAKDDHGIFQTCQEGAPCKLACPPLLGSNKTRTAVWREDTKKGKRVYLGKPKIVRSPLYVSEFGATIPPGISTVFCEARTTIKPRAKAIQEMRIKWVSLPKVISMHATIERRETSEQVLKIKCSAQGRPVPSMSLRAESSTNFLMFEQFDLEKETKTDNFIRVSKEVVLTPEYLDQQLYVHCIAFNDDGQDKKETYTTFIDN